MTDEQKPAEQSAEATEQAEQAPGWQVVDPDGNVVDSGPFVQAQMAADLTQSEGE
jgi:protein involved in polysaccharide export with SLBB domain